MALRFSIDAISVSTYEYNQKAFGTDKNMSQLTKEMTELPIMICGSIYDLASAEDALKDADIILSAKSMLLNPNWLEDIQTNKTVPRYKSDEANIAYTVAAVAPRARGKRATPFNKFTFDFKKALMTDQEKLEADIHRFFGSKVKKG